MKTLRIWSFRALTNRCVLIGCGLEVGGDSGLVGDLEGGFDLLGALLGVEEVCSPRLPSEHLEQVFDCEVGFLEVFSEWCLKRSIRAGY